MAEKEKWNKEFLKRYRDRVDELKWLYCEMYNNDIKGFEWLCDAMYQMYEERPEYLKKLDRQREKKPGWYRTRELLGMMMYVNCFGDTLKDVQKKLDYIKSCGVNILHLMPLLESPKGKDDGGYAVSDFRKVQPELGTMEDLESLAEECHKQGISCCLDFVMNHTSEEHAWAKAARAGDPEARKRYFFYDTWDIPAEYEKTVPQVFPTTAPGNFTWLGDCGQFVMTSFYPYQWDLNYANLVVFNDMVCNLLYLANRGMDIIRLDAVPYIWKELGTSCRNLKEVHTLVRMMRLISEIVCPALILLGEVVMEPKKVVPYFGTVEKPECHMLYNVTTMASTWHTVATRDVALLRRQIDQVSGLPKEYVFLNYLRCHDDIGWGLDYTWLEDFGVEEKAHKKYLNDYLTGSGYESMSRGELYNDDPSSGDARLCGTTASLCGLEAALYERNEDKKVAAIRRILMLHAYLFSQSGIPMLYSGDEIGQLNDYSYKEDAYKYADSRYLHRGKFPWKNVTSKIAKQISEKLVKMEKIRNDKNVFSMDAEVFTFDVGNNHVLGIGRRYGKEEMYCLYNFSEWNQEIQFPYGNGKAWTDLLSGNAVMPDRMEGFDALWLYR